MNTLREEVCCDGPGLSTRNFGPGVRKEKRGVW